MKKFHKNWKILTKERLNLSFPHSGIFPVPKVVFLAGDGPWTEQTKTEPKSTCLSSSSRCQIFYPNNRKPNKYNFLHS